RISAYVVPYHTMIASIPFSLGQGMFVPIDDENCWRYFMAPKSWRNPRSLGGANLFSIAPFSTPVSSYRDGIIPRHYTAGNDYLIDREVQRTSTFSGVSDFVSQDLMVTESMGPIYDRTQEQLGSTDRAISRMRHILISAAKDLAEGKEPPAVGDRDFRSIRGAEKIPEPGASPSTPTAPSTSSAGSGRRPSPGSARDRRTGATVRSE
ncbi:MAG TPA: hypothetical protein VKG80_11945, partial [Trebonia sp.]|nr:hypothetical protein [Trebonia sp.]